MPSMPPASNNAQDKHVVWDLHFTNYNPLFWKGLLKPRPGQKLFEVVEASSKPSSGSGVFPGPQGSAGSGAAGSRDPSGYSGVLPGISEDADLSRHPIRRS